MSYEVEVKDIAAQHVAIVRAETTPDKIGATYGELIAEVSASLAKRSIPTAGPSFGRYFDYSKDHVDMAVGFPVAASSQWTERSAPPRARVRPSGASASRVQA